MTMIRPYTGKIAPPVLSFTDRGEVRVSYDPYLVCKGSAWTDLQTRFRPTFTSPGVYEDTGKPNYEESNPWRKDHRHVGWIYIPADSGVYDPEWGFIETPVPEEPRWAWTCPMEKFFTRYTDATFAQHEAEIAALAPSRVDMPGPSVTLWSRIKTLLWGVNV